MRQPLIVLMALVAVAGFVPGPESSAHIVPVDFGSFDGSVAATNNGTGTGVNAGTSGNYGWIDGADGDWTDSHKVGYYTFSLTGQAADVTLTFRGKSNAFGGSGLTPGFTLYSAEAEYDGDHDFSPGSILLRAADCAATSGCTTTEGSFRALSTVRITNDADPTGTSPSVFTYLGHAYDGNNVTLPVANSPLYDNNPYLVSGGDGVADGVVSRTFQNLHPGNYIAFVGGVNYNSQTNQAARGIGGTLTITPVPVPAAVWLFGSGLAGLVGVMRRRQSAV
ncbi:MAG: VPLPA-CTERM sorting domain-containing protein [Nitrospira sp.]